MEKIGSPAAEFETDEERTSFLVRIPVHPQATRLTVGTGSEDSEGEDDLGGTAPQVTPQLTPQVERAILAWCEELHTAGEILDRLGLRDRKHLRRACLQPMLERGWLELTRPDRPKSRLQRYRTTPAGKLRLV